MCCSFHLILFFYSIISYPIFLTESHCNIPLFYHFFPFSLAVFPLLCTIEIARKPKLTVSALRLPFGKGDTMQQSGYYEIVQHTALHTDLKAHIIIGNVLFNRMHWHDSLEIIYSVYGSLCVHVEGTPFSMQEGDVLVINCKKRHEITDGVPNGLQFILSIDPSLLRLPSGRQYLFATTEPDTGCRQRTDAEALRHAITQIAYLFLSGPMLPAADSFTKNPRFPDNLTEYLQQEEVWYQFHLSLYEILLILSHHTVPEPVRQNMLRQYDRFSMCIDYMHNHYTESLSIRDLADAVGFSEPTLYRLFQPHMGMTFNQYLNMLRINTACGILESSPSIPITELAEQCGYNSLSNFYRAFRQLTGKSPNEYRKGNAHGQQKSMSIQKNLLMLNRFQHFSELPYTREDIRKLLDSSP